MKITLVPIQGDTGNAVKTDNKNVLLPFKIHAFFFLYLNLLPPTSSEMLTNAQNTWIFLLHKDSSVADFITTPATHSWTIGRLFLFAQVVRRMYKYLVILNDFCRNYNSEINKKSVNTFRVKDDKSSYHLIIRALASNLPFWLHSEPADNYTSNIK